MQIRDIFLITILITAALAQTPSRMISLLTSEESIFNTVVGDVDADGDNDILFIREYDEILLAINNNGTYDEVIEIITVDNATGGLYLIDLNNDNALDILIGTYQSPGLVWIENDGLGNFSEVDTISTLRARDLEIVDLDNDGDIDIAICDHDGHGFIYEISKITSMFFGFYFAQKFHLELMPFGEDYIQNDNLLLIISISQ